MSTRRIVAFDFEVTITDNSHLSINGVRAKRLNYFREKSFDFFIDYEMPTLVKSEKSMMSTWSS